MGDPSPKGSAVLSKLDGLCSRLITLSEQISADYTAFMEHVREADRLYRALQDEAAHDRVRASDMVRVTKRIEAVQEAAKGMMQAVAQASVGTRL